MPTRARIATVCQAGRYGASVEESRTRMLDLLDLALRCRPDLVCLPEAFTSSGFSYETAAEVAEPLAGPTIERMAERARQHGCYLIVPQLVRENGQVYNCAVVLDRQGGVAGVYRKVHPVTTSADYTVLEQGVSPGSDYPVFDLDFGRIGVQICFDALFTEGWQNLADQGARVVFWPSAYNGGFPLQAYAALHRFYVISSVRTDSSRIIDPCGVIVDRTDQLTGVVWRDINLDYLVCHYDFNFSTPDRVLAAYPGRVAISSRMDDGLFLLEPTDPALSTRQIAAELGIEPIQQYASRHRAAYEPARRGTTPEPQCAAHGDRPMWSRS